MPLGPDGVEREQEAGTGPVVSLCLLSSQVDNLLLVVMQSAHLLIQRKALQQSIEGLLTLRQEQTSSQPVIARALQQLKVLPWARPQTLCVYLDVTQRDKGGNAILSSCPPVSPLPSPHFPVAKPKGFWIFPGNMNSHVTQNGHVLDE